jgi:hypothetical protein
MCRFQNVFSIIACGSHVFKLCDEGKNPSFFPGIWAKSNNQDFTLKTALCIGNNKQLGISNIVEKAQVLYSWYVFAFFQQNLL